MSKHESSKNVIIRINENEVEVNKFVGEFLKGAIRGILKSLKGIPSDIKKIEIFIEDPEER